MNRTLRVDTNFKNLDDAKLVADLLVDEVNSLRAQLVAKSMQQLPVKEEDDNQ